MESKTNRLLALEGLRGLAAISVVFFHFLVLFYPVLYFSLGTQHSKFETMLFGTPLNAFISGTFAVSIFFVLSGFVLTIGFFQSKKAAIIERLAVKRYLRLMIPALASVILAFLYISLGLSHTSEVFAITQSPGSIPLWGVDVNIFQALYEGTIGVFVEGPAHNFNSVLWTMKYEFIGSFIIFIFALLFGRSKMRWIVYLALILALYNTWFFGFILGTLLADMYVHRQAWLPKKKLYLYPMLIVGIVLGAFPVATTTGTWYEAIKLPWLEFAQNLSMYTALGALLTIIAVLNIVPISKFLSSKPLVTAGKYTYSLYLVHQPIIFTLGTGLFLVFIQHFGYNKSFAAAFVLTIPVIVVMTFLFYRYAEVPSLKFAAFFEKKYSSSKNKYK